MAQAVTTVGMGQDSFLRHSWSARSAVVGAGWLAVALAIFLGVPYIAMLVGLAAQERFIAFDPDRVFAYLYAHHAVEAVGGLVLIVVVGRPALVWISRLGDVRVAVRAIAVFTVVIAALAFLFNVLPVLLGGLAPNPGYPMVARNMTGILLFQLVLVGIGEELLFRGAMLGTLRRVSTRSVRLVFFRVSLAGVLTAVMFGLAHAVFYDIAFWPITLTPNWIQIGYAFGLGVYYAALAERTGSLWGAVVSHNLSDVLYVLALWWAVVAAH